MNLMLYLLDFHFLYRNNCVLYNRRSLMHSQFSSSSPLYDKLGGKCDSKRPLSNYFDTQLNNEKPSNGKILRWKIEESKQNYGTQLKPQFATSFSNHEFSTKSPYSSKPAQPAQTYGESLYESKKCKTAKSYKTIMFSSQFEREYQKERETNDKGDYLKNKENIKGLTMSLGYHANLNNLIGSNTYKKIDCEFRKPESQLRKMKSSKSQKKIRIQTEEWTPTKPFFAKNQYLTQSHQFASKISVDLNKEDQKSFHLSHKSSKTIKLDFTRPKMEKTASHNEHLDTEPLEKLYIKKHQTMEPSKSYHQIGSTHTISELSVPPKQKISINDFQLGKCKGEGAFGQVFPALHKATKMLVAIKKVPKEKVKFMLEQFVSQIKIQLFLEHPNIVKLFGFFDDATNFYIIMEYMEGGNLFGLIKKKKKLSEAETIEKLKEVCLGIKQMHDNCILHRDIKPENIVMTNDVSKLCDLGWAAICKDRRTTYCGTLDYVSPQIIEGEGYDDSVDIWCIGVLAYELICGKTPFYNISRKQTMKRIRDVHYEYPSDISPQAKAFIDKILKKNPDERIGIDEVLKDKFLNP